MKIANILVIFTLFISTSCGYKPIYIKNDKLFLEFKNINIVGDKRINRQIIKIVGLKEKKDSFSENDLTLKTNFEIKETSKNSKGQIETYRSILKIELIIKKDDKIINSKNFLNEFSYNNRNNKFELSQYQNEIKNNLINKSSEEILLFLNLS